MLSIQGLPYRRGASSVSIGTVRIANANKELKVEMPTSKKDALRTVPQTGVTGKSSTEKILRNWCKKIFVLQQKL